jgi:hypothetical protein
VHPDPFRFTAYVDRSLLADFGVPGAVNSLYVLPATGHDVQDVQEELLGLEGVASVQPLAATSQVVEDSLDDFAEVFRVLQVFIVVLALLIAYNAASINADERGRERATLFAFGLPLRRVLALETAEGALLGALGTAVGVAVGLLVVRWVIATTVSSTMPEIGMDVAVPVARSSRPSSWGWSPWPSRPCSPRAGCATWTSPAPCGWWSSPPSRTDVSNGPGPAHPGWSSSKTWQRFARLGGCCSRLSRRPW